MIEGIGGLYMAVVLMADDELDLLRDLAEDGCTQKEMAKELGLSPSTLSHMIAKIKQEEGILLQYRAVRSLKLTMLQAEILDAVTPEKIGEASLGELVGAFKILHDRELLSEGKVTEIKGLIGYLVHMEAEESKTTPDNFTDAEFKEVGESDITAPGYHPPVG